MPLRRLRRPEAAAYLGVSLGFLEKAAVKGYGPPMLRLSKRLVVYDVADLDAWMVARRVRSTSEADAERQPATA
jgi:predicted DNA-binding transcriptional regulator AlpA